MVSRPFVRFIIPARRSWLGPFQFEQPFTDLNPEGIAGVFPERAEKILAVIEDVNKKAEAA